jgi:hypothetical protein
METFIATKIEEQADISLENGQAKYRAYFIKTKIYVKKYKESVDKLLIADGYADVIVEK